MTEIINIPKHWKLASLVNDLQFIKTGVPEYKGKKKYYSTGSIKEDKITSEGEYEFKNKPSRANRKAKLGDVFQARMKDTDKAILITNELDEQLFSTGFFQIRGDDKLFNKFIYYYLTSNLFKQQKDKLCSGSTQSALNDESAKKILVPLPSFEEQQAIVAQIEELLSELENGKQQLLTAQQQLKVYRQSLLKWAFEGKLTNKNVQDGELPSGWKKKQLGNLSEMCLGKMLDKKKNKGDFQPYLRNISVRWGQFDLSDLEEMRFEPHEEERYSLKKGDLIVCEGGEPGRCAIWKGEIPNMKIQKALHRVRVNELLSEVYLFHFMYYSANSGLLKQYFTGTTIKHLTGRELKKIEIPLPPKKEQLLIVDELESKLTVCDKIEETICQSLQQAETLRQSILKKAFEGKLVTAVAEQKETKVIPLYKPKNEYFYQMQLLGIVAKASKQKQIEHGEMTLAKYAYLMDKVYGVPTYFNYNRWHLGPYPPTIKKVINNKQYFKKSGNHIEVLNEKTLFNSTNPHTTKMQSAVNDLTDIFSKYSTKERSHKTELLATVCKVIEDIQSTDLKVVRQSMAEWKINLKGEKHKTKAEKFNEAETEKCLAFIKEKGWDKKLIKRNKK